MDVTLTRPRGQGVGYLDALVHPQLTLSTITSSMAAAQDVETPKILSNSCVNAISSVTIVIVTTSPAWVPRHRKMQEEGASIPFSVYRSSLKKLPLIALKSPNRKEAHPGYVFRYLVCT